MATIAGIKTSIKALLDAAKVGGVPVFGSVYTEARERIENPNPAAVMMWHDSWSQEQAAMGGMYERREVLLLWVFIRRPPVYGETQMQTEMDAKVEALDTALRSNPTLTGTVLHCQAISCTFDYDKVDIQGVGAELRMLGTVRVEVDHMVK